MVEEMETEETMGQKFLREYPNPPKEKQEKVLTKKEIQKLISKKQKKTKISKFLAKRISYKVGKKITRPAIKIQSRVKPEPYRRLYFQPNNVRPVNQPQRSLFFR